MRAKNILTASFLGLLSTTAFSSGPPTIPLLTEVNVKEVKLQEKIVDAVGSGRKLVFSISTDSCFPLVAGLEGTPPVSTVVKLAGIARHEARKSRKSCAEQIYTFGWAPGLEEKNATMAIDFINSKGKGYRATFRAFQSQGNIGPGSATMAIVDYDALKIQAIP